jgi:hypothetical protein
MPSAATHSNRMLCNPEYARALVERLLRLANESDPTASGTDKGKDSRAFDALQTAGELTSALAGWAISHATGLAKKELGFVPFQPAQTKLHQEYLHARSIVDSHDYEAAGATLGEMDEARIVRKMVVNLLLANSGGWPIDLVFLVRTAFEGLEFGDESFIFSL